LSSPSCIFWQSNCAVGDEGLTLAKRPIKCIAKTFSQKTDNGTGFDDVRIGSTRSAVPAVCTENLIRVDDVMESPKLAE
jgi:hypothetical protein